MKKIVTAITLGILTFQTSNLVLAAPVPWVGRLACVGCPTFTLSIPQGKVLVIEQISADSAGTVEFRITSPPAGGIGTNSITADFVYIVQSNATQIVPFPAPLRLGPGMTLTRRGGPTVNLYGTAMDSQDFFASVSPAIRSVTADGSQLTAIVDARTTAPTQVSGESSTNLTAWTESGITVASSASNPRISRITTPQDTSTKFIRARANRKTD